MLINAILKNNTKKIKKMAIVIALLLTPIAYHYAKIAFYNSNSTPNINPHPTQKMRVYGDYPFEKDIELKSIGVEYVNKNSKCNKDKWLLDEIGIPLLQTKTFPVTVKNGKFESIVYLDSYLPGICQWEAYHLHLTVLAKSGNIGFPSSHIMVGTIMHRAFPEQRHIINLEYIKKANFLNYSTFITYRDSLRQEANYNYDMGIGLDSKPNISTTQKEVQVKFLDKGWRE
jgi:hypothetical protein